MKILFVSNGSSVDYQCDVVFHGLKKLYGRDVYETSDNWFMFNDISNEQKAELYGKGFTITGLLDPILKNVITNYEVQKKIRHCFFDLVVYGSIWRCQDFFGLVSLFYPKERIAAIDGEDGTVFHNFFIGKTLYFKRELDNSYKDIFPITFGIPKEKVIDKIKPKEKILAHIIPGDLSTYIYDNESDYYNDYATSYFGKTTKKAGWDCLRHYEIMANGCIPWFPDLSECPKETMISFPKDIILKTNCIFDEISKNANAYDEYLLKEYCEQILIFTKGNLVTEKITVCLLDTVLKQNVSKIDSKIKLRIQWLGYNTAKLWKKIKKRIGKIHIIKRIYEQYH